MGTNYYWHNETNKCEHCGRCDTEEIHIGKSSAGWTFSFHGTEEIRSWKDWQVKVKSGGEVFDEYGDKCSFEDLRQTVEERSHPSGLRNHADLSNPSSTLWKDGEGHSFSSTLFF